MKATETRSASFITTRAFYDDLNFPYGFDRCGEFTCKQVQLLTAHGAAYQALYLGTQPPRTPEEEAFVAFCMGRKPAETEHEKVWKRYLTICEREQTRHPVSLHRVGFKDQVDSYPIDDDFLDSSD